MARKALDGKLRMVIEKRDQGKCRKCGHTGGEIHHIIPVMYGGQDIEINLILLCGACHAEWHAITESMPDEHFVDWLDTIPAFSLYAILKNIRDNKDSDSKQYTLGSLYFTNQVLAGDRFNQLSGTATKHYFDLLWYWEENKHLIYEEKTKRKYTDWEISKIKEFISNTTFEDGREYFRSDIDLWLSYSKENIQK